jgi:hypothetical protein
MFAEALDNAVWDQLSHHFKRLEPAAASRVESALNIWLVTKARKLPLPDLPARLTEMSARIEKLSKALVLKLDSKKITVSTVDGETSDTLVLLGRGSDWFDGHPDVTQAIAKAIFNA